MDERDEKGVGGREQKALAVGALLGVSGHRESGKTATASLSKIGEAKSVEMRFVETVGFI